MCCRCINVDLYGCVKCGVIIFQVSFNGIWFCFCFFWGVGIGISDGSFILFVCYGLVVVCYFGRFCFVGKVYSYIFYWKVIIINDCGGDDVVGVVLWGIGDYEVWYSC